MFKDLKAYPRYGRAGLPQGWDVVRTASVARLLVSNVDKLSNDGETPVQLCNYVDVYRNDYISRRLNFMQATATPTEIQAFSVRQGDVLITKDSESWTDIGVPAYVPGDVDGVVCGYHLAMLRPLRAGLLGEYLFRVLQVPSVAAQLHVAATGVTRYGLSQGSIRKLRVPLPSPVEQAAIVKFLAHAHRRIGRAIAAKRKLIALLEEQKQAVINRAVTYGLDPSVPLEDPGTPWVDLLPSGWQVRRLRTLLTAIEQGVSPQAESIAPSPAEWGVLKAGCVNGGVFRESQAKRLPGDYAVPTQYRVCAGDLLMSRASGSPHLVGSVARVNEVRGQVILSDKIFRLRLVDGVDPDYLACVMGSTPYRAQVLNALSGADGLASNLPIGALKDFVVPLPELGVQREIVGHVDLETTSSAAAIDGARREIDLLREFRTRLTSDVVTGQLDVRHIAATLPDLDPGEPADDVGAAEDDLVDEAAEPLEAVDT